jgi:hypothetical protein
MMQLLCQLTDTCKFNQPPSAHTLLFSKLNLQQTKDQHSALHTIDKVQPSKTPATRDYIVFDKSDKSSPSPSLPHASPHLQPAGYARKRTRPKVLSIKPSHVFFQKLLFKANKNAEDKASAFLFRQQ